MLIMLNGICIILYNYVNIIIYIYTLISSLFHPYFIHFLVGLNRYCLLPHFFRSAPRPASCYEGKADEAADASRPERDNGDIVGIIHG